MSKQASPVMIGVFTVGTVVLVLAGLLMFGSGQLFTTTHPYVLYFDGAINGLQVDGPVQFQGVQIGSVTAIKATVNEEDLKVRIPVFIAIKESSVEQVGTSKVLVRQDADLWILVQQGMPSRLQLQSMVTGLLFIQLDFFPDFQPVNVRLDPDTTPTI